MYAAHQDAEHRYQAAAVKALCAQRGRDVIADPAWPTVVRRLFDAEVDGWDPARLLAVIANRRELETADSIAEVLTWRIDGYLAANPEPPRGDHPYEPTAEARDRLASIAATTLGTRIAERAQVERAWPALLAALRRAEAVGHDPAGLLTAVATARELATARSVSEVLAWRIGRHLASSPPLARPEAQPPAENGLPWIARPCQPEGANISRRVARYLDEASELITARVHDLASIVVRHRPAWTLPLGQAPDNLELERQWLHHVGIIAAYRDQFKVTTNDPRQILGPYAEPGHPGHKAYWHAAESVLAARRLSGLGPAQATSTPDARTYAQLATDIYRALPEHERTAISREMAARLGPLWFGNPTLPDEATTTQPAHARTLAATLIQHGLMTPAPSPAREQLDLIEPLEADLARRGRPTRPPRSTPDRRPEQPSSGHPMPRPTSPQADVARPTPQP